jgi:excisionase family DNA binding protein
MSNPAQPLAYTDADVASLLHVSKRTVYRLRKSGALPVVHIGRARDPADSDRNIEDVSDLTLGEYIRLLENPKRWEKLAVKIDRKTFVEELKRVGRIRNDVMHFDPDGPSPEDLKTLRKCVKFLSDLEKKLV